MSPLTVVVAGFPEAGDALSRTGHFDNVYSISSTGGLRDLIAGGKLPQDGSQVVFLFADTTIVDTTQTLDTLIQKLTSRNQRVILLGISGEALRLLDANPGAYFLEAPFTANILLAAISGAIGGMLEPVPRGFDPIVPGGGFGPQTSPVEPAPTTAPPAAGTPAPTRVAPTPPTPLIPPTPPAPPAPPTPPVPAPDEPPTPGTSSNPWTRPAESPAPESAPVQRPITSSAPPNTPSPFSSSPVPVRPIEPTPQRSTFDPPTPRPLVPRRTGEAMRTPVRSVDQGGAPSTYSEYVAPAGQRRTAKVITITSPKGGTGKSTLALNLSAYLGLRVKQLNKRVCLIDANFQQADAGKMLNQYNPNITNIIKDPSSLSPNSIERYLIERPDLNLSVLLGPASPEDANPLYLNARLFNQVLDALRHNFDYIFIDTPVAELYHDLFRGFALPAADFILVPITPSIHTIMNVDGWLQQITLPRHSNGDDVDPNKVGIVLNQAEEGVDIGEEQIRRELSKWHFLGSIPRSRAWINAVNNSELVATKNYSELNTAFSQILYYATGEDILRYSAGQVPPGVKKGGLLTRLLGRK